MFMDFNGDLYPQIYNTYKLVTKVKENQTICTQNYAQWSLNEVEEKKLTGKDLYVNLNSCYYRTKKKNNSVSAR